MRTAQAALWPLIGLVAVAAIGFVGDGARAGPWTLGAGETASYLSLEARRAPARFDAAGQPASGERYSGAASLTLERGLLDWATVGLKSESRAVLLDTDGANARNAGEASRELWLRTRLWDEGPYVGSVQIGYAMPGAAPEIDGLELEDGAHEVETRALLGRGWAYGQAIGWMSAEGALRVRNHDARDQIRLDATIGARPRAAPRLLALGQLFSTTAVGGGDRGDYDLVKLGAGVGYEVFDGFTVVAGGITEVSSRNVTRGNSATLSLWVRY